jgi:hypothetical protein
MSNWRKRVWSGSSKLRGGQRQIAQAKLSRYGHLPGGE